MTQFTGIFPALLTPFHSDRTINHAALRKLIQLNLRKGVAGFYACGSTSEAFLLESSQRKELLETIVDEVAGKALIIAHIGAISQNAAVDLACHANKLGVDAISSIPPFYYGFPFDCIRRYYLALADSVSVPVLIYHFPANSGVTLSLNNALQFLDDSRFAGIKYTSNDLFMLSQLRMSKPEAAILNGYDEIFLSGLVAGANGGVGSTYNVMAEKFIAIQSHFAKGEVAKAQHLQQEANRIIAAFIQLGVMPAEKAALRLMGIDMGQCLPPFQQIDAEQEQWLYQILKENQCHL